jgi:prepilin signal peptidase PulO-like enzyme (type II secretory pathway)
MYEFNVVQGCESIVGSLAVMAIIVTALATMVGLVKPADTVKYCGTIVGIAIVLILIVSVFVGLWSSMSLWQKVVIAAMGFGVWWMRRERNRPRKKREEE